MRAVVVGDDIWDRYIQAEPVGYANKTLAPVIRHLRPLGDHRGGTWMVGRHMAQFSKSVVAELPSPHVTKTRYVTPPPDRRTLFEVLDQPASPVSAGEFRRIMQKVALTPKDIIVYMDYGHGLFVRGRRACSMTTPCVVNVQSNSWSRGYQDTQEWCDIRPTLLVMDEAEFQQAMHDRTADERQPCFPCPYIVTHGIRGLYHSQFGTVPGQLIKTVDRTGAGDAALALAALMLAAKQAPEIVAWSAGVAGAVKAANVWGNERPILHEEYVEFVKNL